MVYYFMEDYTKTLNDAFNQITIVYRIFFLSDKNPPLTYIISEIFKNMRKSLSYLIRLLNKESCSLYFQSQTNRG